MLEDRWISWNDKYFDNVSENLEYLLHKLSLEYNPKQGKIRCFHNYDISSFVAGKRNYTLNDIKNTADGWKDLYEFILADQNKNVILGEN